MPKRQRKRDSGEECDARPPAAIFTDFQEAGSYLHEKLQKELEEFYQEHAEEENLFEDFFRGPLLCLLNAAYTSPFVKKTIPLVVHFMAKRLEDEDADEERQCTSPFLAELFSILWTVQGLEDKNLRYNSCKILADLLQLLADKDISMDEELYEKIMHIMISERIIDKVVDIRELAVKVLQWLQDISSPNCKATKTLLYHLDKDPSVEVRKTILSVIRMTSVTVKSIVRRTRDINEAVRVQAFKIMADKRRMNSISYSLREKIIMSGLQDTSSAVRTVAETYLLPKWAAQMQGDLVEFVNNLDVNFRPSVPRQALPHLFKDKTPEELIEFLRIPESEKYVLPEQLTPALALYWSCLAKHFSEKGETEALEKILGSLSELVHYIDCFYKQEIPKDKDLNGMEQKEDKVLRISVLIFLLELFSYCDMSDEVGRSKMAEIMMEILKSEDHQPDRRLLTKITCQLTVGIPDPFARVETVVNLLTDLYYPIVHPEVEPAKMISAEEKRAMNVAIAYLKKDLCNLQIAKEKAIDSEQFVEAQELKAKIDSIREDIKKKEEEMKGPGVLESQDVALEREETKDPSIQYKCLVILCELLKNKEVFQVSLGFEEIVEHFVRKCIGIDQEHIMLNGLEALGLYCMQSHIVAQKHLPMFYVLLINDIRPYESVRAKCLQCIVTLLVCHGRERLAIPDEEWNISLDTACFDTANRERNQMGYLLSVVNNMDSESDLVKRQAIIGACQLLLSDRVKSAKLLAKIIIIWYLPATTEAGHLVKLIGQFLTHYATENCNAPQMLTEAIMIALEEILTCSHSSELQELDPKEVGFFILDMCKPGTNKYTEENFHDKIARKFLEKLEFEDSEVSQGVYLRLLVNLSISYQDNAIRESLLETTRRIRRNNLVNSKNKDLLRFLMNLQGRPESQDSDNMSSTPMADRRTLIMDKENLITPIRKSLSGEDDIEMDSDDDSVFNTPQRKSLRT